MHCILGVRFYKQLVASTSFFRPASKMADPLAVAGLSPATSSPQNEKTASPVVPTNTAVKGEDAITDRQTLLAVLQFLRKTNLKGTEDALRKEANFYEEDKLDTKTQSDSDVTNVLSAYKSEGDPDIYEGTYTSLKRFIESALDMYRHELAMILYPVFVHMYLELVYNSHEEQAIKFMDKFGVEQEEYYQDDIQRLACITKQKHMKGNELMDNFMCRSSHFTVRMSRDTYTFLKRHLQEKKENVLLNIIQEHLYLDVYEGVPRSKQQVDATAGAMMGEATRQANKAKVYYGLLKEPDIQVPVEEEEDLTEGEGGDKPKKKRLKKDPLLSKKAKNDPNAPPNNRIPLPELKDADKQNKVNALRESAKRVKLSPESLPSICFYTFLNAQHHSLADLLLLPFLFLQRLLYRLTDCCCSSYLLLTLKAALAKQVTCAEISEDSSLLSVGFADSFIRVWSLVYAKLKGMKPANDLATIDREADDVLVRMMDDRSSQESKLLLGHSGPVYAVSFSPDKNYLLSSSEDTTIRLWSLQTWTNLVCYKGHTYPVWDIKFSPHGYYFASCGHDRTARVWATEYHQPLRVFVGHVSDIDCVQFHPNSHYVATGSSDRSVRLWDMASGACVRFMTGHKGPVHCLAFSIDGRFLATSGTDKRILLWDISHGHLLAELRGHTDTVYTMAFSRDGNILATGGIDYSVRLWDANKLFEEIDVEDLNISHTPAIKTNTDNLLLGTFPTKVTTVLSVHFTRRNLLLATGMYCG